MKRIIWLVTGIAVSISLIVAVLSLRTAQRSLSVASELANQNKRLAAEIADASQRLAARIRDEETLRSSLQQAQSQKEQLSSAGDAKALATSKAPVQPPRRDLADLMEANPALRTLFKQSFRANLGLRFLSWYKKAHVSPEQIERFEVLMTDAEQDKVDLQAAAKTQGLMANDPSLANVRQQAAEKLRKAQKEILGDASYQSLLQDGRLRPLEGFTMSFASLVAYAGTPVSAPQIDQLLDVLGNASSQYQTGGRANLSTIDTKRMLQQAEPILTPVQYAALKANTNHIELSKLSDQFYQQKKAAAK
jgi:hypothetical protein